MCVLMNQQGRGAQGPKDCRRATYGFSRKIIIGFLPIRFTIVNGVQSLYVREVNGKPLVFAHYARRARAAC